MHRPRDYFLNKFYFERNLLKINDIYKLELAKYMYKIYNKHISEYYQNKFKLAKHTHSHNTRYATKNNYSLTLAKSK